MPRKPRVGKAPSADPDDAPELTKAFFASADIYHGARPVRRGRPKADVPKQQVTLRLDVAVVEGLGGTGPGWQTRANQALKAFLEKPGTRRAPRATTKTGRA